MEDITDFLLTYRECARNIWNVCIRNQMQRYERDSMGEWDISDEFDDICTKLFHIIVLGPIGKINDQKANSYNSVKDALSFLHVVPKGEVPISINREVNSTTGYWDYPPTSIKHSDADMRFVDFFDFDKLGYRDFQYYHVRIVASVQYRDLVGRDALIAPQYATVFFES